VAALPADLPAAAEGFEHVVPAKNSDEDADPEPDTELPLQVFQTWVERFSHCSQETLGVDMLLAAAMLSPETLLDAIADFLWTNRHLAIDRSRSNAR
jgi:hypothetical protein